VATTTTINPELRPTDSNRIGLGTCLVSQRDFAARMPNNISSGQEADLPVALEHKSGFGQLRLRFCVLCAPLILVIVAAAQLYNAHFRNLTPWEGGGFGMFSTVDSMGNRLLRCTLITDRGDFPIEIPPSMHDLRRQATSIPTPELLSDFARQLTQVTWEPSRRSGNSETSNGADASELEYKMIAKGEYYGYSSHHLPLGTGDRANLVGVRVEVMRLVFDSREQCLSAEQILAVTHKRED
jgi:hypothetical protein